MHPEVRMMYGLPKLIELVSKKSPGCTRRDRCAPSGLMRFFVLVMVLFRKSGNDRIAERVQVTGE